MAPSNRQRRAVIPSVSAKLRHDALESAFEQVEIRGAKIIRMRHDAADGQEVGGRPGRGKSNHCRFI